MFTAVLQKWISKFFLKLIAERDLPPAQLLKTLKFNYYSVLHMVFLSKECNFKDPNLSEPITVKNCSLSGLLIRTASHDSKKKKKKIMPSYLKNQSPRLKKYLLTANETSHDKNDFLSAIH